jgi:hypothetical protein
VAAISHPNQLRIAQIAPLYERVPPKVYGSVAIRTERSPLLSISSKAMRAMPSNLAIVPFDLVFSNSVIEHVGPPAKRIATKAATPPE